MDTMRADKTPQIPPPRSWHWLIYIFTRRLHYISTIRAQLQHDVGFRALTTVPVHPPRTRRCRRSMDIPQDVPVHKSGRLDRSHEVFIVQTVFVVMAGICVLVRAYIKCFVIKLNLLDDYLIYGAAVGLQCPFQNNQKVLHYIY